MNATQMATFSIRVSTQTRDDLDRFAESLGITRNAAVNVLLRRGLQAESKRDAR